MIQAAHWTIPIATMLMAAAIFTVDHFSPLGYAVWLAYLLPLWFTRRAPYLRYPSVFAGLCSVLTLADYLLSQTTIAPEVDLFNRGFGIVVIWAMAYLLERSTTAERLRNVLLQDLGHAHDRLRQLSHRLLQTQERERRHLARDLHDEIGQALTALKLNLREAQDLNDPVPGVTLIADSLCITDQLIKRIRNLALDLRPSLLDELGLVSALRWYVTRQAERVGWTLDYAIQELEHRLAPEIEVVCFRVVQEALTNAARHAQATHLCVALSCFEDSIELVVQDNGVGFDVAEMRKRARSGNSIGLLAMQERAHLIGGSVEVQSQPQDGTKIIVRVPLTLPLAKPGSAQREAS